LEGVDPFLVLGILVTENPPIAKSNASSSYEEGYGKIPVDGTAIYDFCTICNW
jgi:hypothetical protein